LNPEKQKADDAISLAQLKEHARKILPKSSFLRKLILAEPDHLPRDVAIGKIEIFLRLLYQEMGRTAISF